MARTRDGRDPPGGDVAVAATEQALAAVFREEAGRLAASLVQVLGDFAAAEEVVQDSLLVAWERWRADGIPGNPSGWLWTVARRRALDVARRDVRYQAKLALLAASPGAQADAGSKDDRLALIFTCCHPALAHEAQVALTLRTVSGLSAGQIASAFLVSEPTIMQRLTRARRKIAAAGIPYRVPDADHLAERLAAVLSVIYLTFNEGYLTSSGDDPQRRDLTEDAEWLAGLLADLMPAEPEVLGLLALIRLHRARARARFDSGGRLVLLADQDRALWDHAAIAAAADLVVRAARMRKPGPYQIQAAIVACHAEARSWQETDWPQILLLYEALTVHLPTPVAALHRAIAHGQVAGPAAALADLDALAGTLGSYHLFHATRAQLLRASATPPRRAAPMNKRSASPATPPNVPCSNSGSPRPANGRITDMARPEHGIAAQIRNIEQAYGKPVSAWIDLVTASRLSRHPDIVAMLKTEHGMTHGAAHRVALLARDASMPSPADPVGALYAGRKAALRPIHDKLIQVVSELGDDVEQVPKKRYLSLRRARQFAMIQPSAADRIDVGLILKATEPAGRLESARGFNPLFTHRVRIHSTADIDTDLTAWLRDAYQGAG